MAILKNSLDYGGYYEIEIEETTIEDEEYLFCQNANCPNGRNKKYPKSKMVKEGNFLLCSENCKRIINTVKPFLGSDL